MSTQRIYSTLTLPVFVGTLSGMGATALVHYLAAPHLCDSKSPEKMNCLMHSFAIICVIVTPTVSFAIAKICHCAQKYL